MAEQKLNENMVEELDWDSYIEEESEFTLLPDGDYRFEVIKLEKGSYTPKSPGGKIPSCKMATVTCRITAENGESTVCSRNLFLAKNMEWLLSEFFVSIGQKKPHEGLKMNWSKVEGSEGILRLGTRKGTGEYADNVYNDIKKFLPPDSKTTSSGGGADW